MKSKKVRSLQEMRERVVPFGKFPISRIETMGCVKSEEVDYTHDDYCKKARERFATDL